MDIRSWDRGNYRVSTDPGLLQVDAINTALSSDMVWWAGDLPADALWEALRKSVCFGLYHKTSPAKGLYSSELKRGCFFLIMPRWA